MSTSKRTFSKFLLLSTGTDDTNIKSSKNNFNNNNNNIPRAIISSSDLNSNSFKISKKHSSLSNCSSSSSTFSLSSSAAITLLSLNKFNNEPKYLNPIEGSDSNNDGDRAGINNNNDNYYYYHFNSNTTRNISKMRPNPFSLPHEDMHNDMIKTIKCTNNNNNSENNSETLDSSFDDIEASPLNSKDIVSREDLFARERCFDYIVQAIDEVWARYCDTTSSAEADIYGDWNMFKKQKKSNNNDMPSTIRMNKPTRFYYNKPINFSDIEQDEIFDKSNTKSINAISEHSSSTIIGPEYDDDEEEDDEGYKTEVTEYETDSSCEYRTVSKLPDSIKLESLKLRLTKAKQDLESVYDSLELEDSIIFWKRWDMIKYSAIEVMEDDDDDEIVEDAIHELEDGRYFNK